MTCFALEATQRPSRRLLVTGGAGFIGSNFVHHWINTYPADRLVVLDALTYAGNRQNLAGLDQQANFRFVQGDTYGLPTLITNCSNNYGPYHFPEQLIPLICVNILRGQPLPVYGDGQNVRDWLYVGDHCLALDRVIQQGKPGETYGVGGNNEVTNLELVKTLCALMDELVPDLPVSPASDLITFVTDRPGHDRRYGIDASKIRAELGWVPQETLASGLRQTVAWYLAHRDWWQPLLLKADQAIAQRLK